MSSNKNNIFRRYLLESNPLTVLVLGVCSALAVTVRLREALIMGAALTLVSAFSCFAVSALRKTIPSRIRIIVELLIVSFFVILADELLQAFAFDISRNLSVYVGLIITNCIIMGRLESYALVHSPLPSLVDGFMSGLGYALVLALVALVREFFGQGTLLGHQIIPQGWYCAEGGFYENNSLMLLPPAALIIVGCIVWIQRSLDKNTGEDI